MSCSDDEELIQGTLTRREWRRVGRSLELVGLLFDDMVPRDGLGSSLRQMIFNDLLGEDEEAIWGLEGSDDA